MGNKKKLSRKTKSHSYKENAKLMNDVIRKKKLQNSNESEVSHIVKRPRLGDKNEINSSKDDYHELTTVESLGIRGENTSTNKNDETSKHTIEVEIVPENETVQASLEKEDTGYDIEMENATDNVIKVGQRIINVSKFLEKLYHISNHGPLECGFSCLQLVGEKLHGLSSKLTFSCKMCKLRFVLETDDEDGCLPVNACAVAATISIGCGHSQLQQFSSAVNLPIISQKTYRDSHKLLSENWEQLAQQSMNQAAEEERNIAIAEGNVTKDGTPVIDVLVDGVYSKRSYKKNYSALSGAAAIIGRKKGKILYMGVRNKYCYHCDRAEKRKSTIPKHFCCKNYTGPSTGMESEIIVEGFRKSLSTHGLIYGRMISNGDSSTYSKILQARPYKDVTVEKIECKNHLLRNFCNKMQLLQTDAKHLVKHRKLLTAKRIMMMRSTIIKSIKNNKSHPCPQEEHLFDDISQAHNHAFGNHVKCKTYFCDKTGIVEQDEMIKEFNLSTLWQKICLLIQGIACHARSLLHDVDSNIVENYHSIIAKYVGGKRINFSLQNSYQTRCMASAVSFNEENALSKLYKKITHKSPRGKLKMLEDRRSKMKKLSKRYTRKKTRQTFLGKRTKDDKHYGDKCEKPDVPEDVLEKIKQDFLNSLKKTDSERAVIERKTILQSASGEWLEMRRSLLTASNFSRVIKRRPNTLCANLVKDILYKKNLDHVESINHGQKCEKAALAQLAVQEKIVIKPCGLFIDKDLCFLGASPDGLIGDDKIVEIKCPLTVNKLGLDAAIRNKKLTFWTITKSGETVNKKHPWFYQIQGQLHITQRKMCLFAVWVNETEKLKTEVIQRDDEFWDKQMKDKLIKFYMDCLLPEILDPRISRNMKIREPYRTPECSQPDINNETRDGNNDRDKDSDVTEPTADHEYSYRQNRIEDEDQENNFLEAETSRRCLDFSYF